MSITAIVMASGLSKRMGKNKLILMYNGKTFIEILLDKLAILFDNIIVVASNYNVIKLCDNYNNKILLKSKINIVNNENPELGQSNTIKLGVLATKKNSNYMFFVADQPLLDLETIKILLTTFNEKNKIIVPTNNGRNGNPVIFPNRFKERLLLLEGDVGGKEIIIENKNEVEFINIASPEALKDIDTIDDYKNIIHNVI